MPIFGVVCIDLRQPLQKCLPLSRAHVLERPLGVPLLRCQEPPIRGVGHLDGRVLQHHEPRLVSIHPWGGDRVERSNSPAQSQFNDAIKNSAGQNSKKMHTTKRSHFSIPWPIPPPPSRAEDDCGVFEVYKRVNLFKWAAHLPIGHALPTPKASIFPLFFVATNIAAFPSHI